MSSSKKNQHKKKQLPGISLELAVVNIQKMLDPNSTITHDEKLKDRVGNIRQYDVVIRGKFGGRPVLGVIECKDHSRKKGPNTIEAFSKKTENLGANLRLVVSRKGFTKQALQLARHEYIGCLSLLPDNPEQVGFSVGNMWYGVIRMWSNIRLTVHFQSKCPPISNFDSSTVKWKGKKVINWFLKELFTTYSEIEKEGTHYLTLNFSEHRDIEIEGKEYGLIGISCSADREYKKKKKWVYWSGDGLFDWNENKFTIPPKGTITGSAVETDLREWNDFNGEIPVLEEKSKSECFINVIEYKQQKWDPSMDIEVPDLAEL
jgi:hypothetical protein